MVLNLLIIENLKPNKKGNLTLQKVIDTVTHFCNLQCFIHYNYDREFGIS